MIDKIIFYVLIVLGLLLIIYGLTEFSFSSMVSILSLSVGIAFVGIAAMVLYSSEK